MFIYILAWLPIVLLAILNGAARELGYKKRVGELAAHQISTLTLLILFTLYTAIVLQRIPPESESEALRIGFVWLALTMAFEFGLGRFQGHSWKELLSEYNILKGKLWILIPLWVTIAPWLFYKLNE